MSPGSAAAARPLRQTLAAPADLALGIGAALALPFLLQGSRFRSLLEVRDGVSAGHRHPARRSIRVGFHTLRFLKRLPLAGRLWRSTCLYRSGLACLILRKRGHPARVRLGSRRLGGPGGELRAHAWVEVVGGGPADRIRARPYTPFEFPTGAG